MADHDSERLARWWEREASCCLGLLEQRILMHRAPGFLSRQLINAADLALKTWVLKPRAQKTQGKTDLFSWGSLLKPQKVL